VLSCARVTCSFVRGVCGFVGPAAERVRGEILQNNRHMAVRLGGITKKVLDAPREMKKERCICLREAGTRSLAGC